MKNESVVVFGAGRFGSALAKELYEQGVEVLVVDINHDRVQELSSQIPNIVRADILDEGALEELGLGNFDVAVVAIGQNLEASIVATVAAKEHGIPLIYGKAQNELQSRILKKVGADFVVFPEMEMGMRLGRAISKKSIMEYIHFSDQYSIMEIVPPHKWIGRTIKDIDISNKYSINVIAVRKEGETLIVPLRDVKIEETDRLIVIGEDSVITKLEKDG